MGHINGTGRIFLQGMETFVPRTRSQGIGWDGFGIWPDPLLLHPPLHEVGFGHFKGPAHFFDRLLCLLCGHPFGLLDK